MKSFALGKYNYKNVGPNIGIGVAMGIAATVWRRTPRKSLIAGESFVFLLIIENSAKRADIVARFDMGPPFFALKHRRFTSPILRVHATAQQRDNWIAAGFGILSDDHRTAIDATAARAMFTGLNDLEWDSFCAALLVNQGD